MPKYGFSNLAVLWLFLFTGFVPFTQADTSLTQQLIFDQTGESQWTEQEIASIRQFLTTLPEELLEGLKNTKPIHLFFHHGNQKHITVAFKRDLHLYRDTQLTLTRQLLHLLLHHYAANIAIERDDAWLQLSGWKKTLGIFTTANNQDPRAYANPLGAQNPLEDFVTSAEYYLLPPPAALENTLKCRLPRKYFFMIKQFPNHPSPLADPSLQCQEKDHGLLDDVVFYDPNNGEKMDLGPINENTVKGFELLYATPGTGDASEVAGHLLLRLLLDNNPQADGLDEPNPKDLVISFLANTAQEPTKTQKAPLEVRKECKTSWLNLVDNQGEFNAFQSVLQALKGLSGGFLTIMDKQTLAQTIKNYTIEEDRDLIRYRFNLTQKQKKDLLEYLYQAKKNYNAKYYFFHQNCGSVLVKVIGQGLGVKAIADFDPIVSPPNSLVALMVREGLLTPIFPSIHSYKKKAHLAQELLRQRLDELKHRYTSYPIPAFQLIMHPKEKKRLRAVEQLVTVANEFTETADDIYPLMQFIQEAEMAYTDKNLACENYTSSVTAYARSYQKQYLLTHQATALAAIDTGKILADSYVGIEQEAIKQGVPYTNLFSYDVAIGQWYQTNNHTLVRLGAGLDKQDMGSMSYLAMQRSSYLKLATAHINFSTDDSHPFHSWQITGLHIRKFKERLAKTPSYFARSGSMGLGLSLLDFTAYTKDQRLSGAWLGGEILFNVAASVFNNNYAFISLGADYRQQNQFHRTNNGIGLPLYFESLVSLGKKRKLQWRNNLEYVYAADQDLHDEIHLNTTLAYRLGKFRNQLLVLKFTHEYASTRQLKHWRTPSYLSSLAIEFNPY